MVVLKEDAFVVYGRLRGVCKRVSDGGLRWKESPRFTICIFVWTLSINENCGIDCEEASLACA
jgi:hypothetical protein